MWHLEKNQNAVLMFINVTMMFINTMVMFINTIFMFKSCVYIAKHPLVFIKCFGGLECTNTPVKQRREGNIPGSYQASLSGKSIKDCSVMTTLSSGDTQGKTTGEGKTPSEIAMTVHCCSHNYILLYR